MEDGMEIPLKKTRNKTTYDPAIPLLGIYTEETKIEKDKCTPMFIAALFTIARIWSESHLVVFVSLQTHGLHGPWNFPGQNTEVDSLSLLQGIFPTQGSNPGHLHCRQILHHLSYQDKPIFLYHVLNLIVLYFLNCLL